MKLKRRFIIVIFMYVLIIIFLSSCTRDIDLPLGEGLLSNEDAKRILEEEGLILTEVSEQPSIKRDTNILPISYEVGEGEDKLFIYVFHSIASRKEVFPFTYGAQEIEEGKVINLYAAKNIAIVYEVNQELSAELASVYENIANAVFYRMNDVQEVVFQGVGDYWNANLNLEYFEYEWENNEGEGHLEYYGRYEILMSFLGEDFEEVSDLAFQFSIQENEWIGMGISSNESEGVLKEGGTFSRSNTINIPIENEAIDFTIEWNGHEEKFILMKE